MITIEYTPEGVAWSDFDAQRFVDTIKEMQSLKDVGDILYRVSTEVTILTVITEIALGNLILETIQFKQGDDVFSADRLTTNWPLSFCDAERALLRINAKSVTEWKAEKAASG